MKHPRMTYWAEKARSKMKRWVEDGTHRRRSLAALGVPMNLMTPEQRKDVDLHYPVGSKVVLP